MTDRNLKQVTISFSPQGIRGYGYDEFFTMAERAVVIMPASIMPEKAALLTIIKWLGEPNPEWLLQFPLMEDIAHLGSTPDGEMYLLMGKEDPWYYDLVRTQMEDLGVFFDWPIILEPERVTIKYIGYLENIAKVLEFYKDFDVPVIMESICDYRPYYSNGLEALTPKQADYIKTAYAHGFFNDKRRTTIKSLAEKKGVSPAAFMKTLRRAERKIIRNVLRE